MICRNCKAGADLRASITPEPPAETEPVGVIAKWKTSVAEADRLHATCEGGEQGCGCQHRGTSAFRRPDGSTDGPAALVTSPAVSA
jgi:hypothetical protein